MKKTISITLNGLVFSLEEDAYETLKQYLSSIENHYGRQEEKKEIMADIESSIAEKFSKKIKTSKEAVTLENVEETIKIMGTVEEITETDEISENKETKEEETPISKRKLYRDTDDVIIAGVASGIAAYFGINPLTVRLIFFILIFVHGLGILAYIIFWIALPKAETSAQKLEMRGKPVNLSEIEQVVKEKSKIISEESKKALGQFKNNNVFIKILNIPVYLVKVFFIFIKKAWSIFWPAVSIFCGIMVIIGSAFAIMGASVFSSIIILNITSPYIISDLPLAELAKEPLYYIGVISFYAACVLPMILLTALGVSLIRRKNSFHAKSLSILAGIWMLAIIIFSISAINLAPMVKTKVQEADIQKNITRYYDYKDFNKLYLGGRQTIKVTKGDNFSIKLSGRESDLDRLNFYVEEGQMQITQKEREGICFFCNNQKITGEITMPKIDSFVGINLTDTELKGFADNIYVSLGEEARADMELDGQDINGKLSGIGSKLNLTGRVKTAEFYIDGSADLNTEKLEAQSIKLDINVFGKAKLNGQVSNLEINAKDTSEISAFNLAADNVKIIASDYAQADVNVLKSLNAISSDSAEIYYKGDPKDIFKEATDSSSIEIGNGNEKKVYIKTDVKQYNPAMSSIRGIGLTPEFYGRYDKNIIFRFSTNQGYLIENFEDGNYLQEIDLRNKNQKIYWTFMPGENRISTTTPIYIYLEVKPEDNNEPIASTRIEFITDEQGVITQRMIK